MKQGCLIVCLLVSFSCYSQKEVTGYIEIKGSLDVLGGINMEPVAIPKQPQNRIDSLIDYKEINSAFAKRNNTPVRILNALSLQGWTLVSVVHVPTDKEGRPSWAFVLYYFKRSFMIDKTQ